MPFHWLFNENLGKIPNVTHNLALMGFDTTRNKTKLRNSNTFLIERLHRFSCNTQSGPMPKYLTILCCNKTRIQTKQNLCYIKLQ